MGWLRRAERVGRRFLNPVPTAVGGPGIAWKILPQYLTNREERSPKVAPGPFRTDGSLYALPPASGLRVTWMGHSSMLVEIDGVRVLIDPVWDQRASPAQWFGPKRFFPPTIPLDQLPQLDAVLISHDHYDHLGAGTVRRLAQLQPQARWVTSVGVGAILERCGVHAGRIAELDWTEKELIHSIDGAALEIVSLPSRHFSGRSFSNRFETLWGSFVLRGAEHAVYYGADSGWWDGFAEIGAEYGPFDLAMLEIGAYNVLWEDIHLGPDGAVRAFADLSAGRSDAGMLMPIHWGLFDLALHAWRQPIERLLEIAEVEGIRVWSPQPGSPSEVVRGVGLRPKWWQQRAG